MNCTSEEMPVSSLVRRVVRKGTENACRALFSSAPVCTENLIRVDAVMESPKLAE